MRQVRADLDVAFRVPLESVVVFAGFCADDTWLELEEETSP